jgi:F5/8 type C domain.
MAGSAKPNIEGLNIEADYTLVRANSNIGQTGMGLFDGTQSDEWNTNRVFYWYDSTDYIEVEIRSKLVNIWRSGTSSWPGYTSPLQIYKLENDTFVNVTSQYPQTITPINHTNWEKTISNLPKGRYRFIKGASLRIDSEWFIEKTYYPPKILLSSSGKIYSLGVEEKKYETKMTSNATPAPYVASSSSYNNSTYYAWKAFNGTNVDREDCWASENNLTTGWIQIDFGEPKKVNTMQLTSRNDSASGSVSAPKDFSVLGSNDGTNFTLIKEITNQINWNANETRLFDLGKGNKYRYYRLKIDSTSGYSSYIAIGEILYSYVENNLSELNMNNNEAFEEFGMDSIVNFDNIFENKNYILQDGINTDSDGLWKQKISRKPLSIKFE